MYFEKLRDVRGYSREQIESVDKALYALHEAYSYFSVGRLSHSASIHTRDAQDILSQAEILGIMASTEARKCSTCARVYLPPFGKKVKPCKQCRGTEFKSEKYYVTVHDPSIKKAVINFI